MPQNKINILCTKAIDEALIKDAASKKIFIEVVSFIKTKPIRSKEIQQEIGEALLLSATVVFTSVNAVEAIAKELNDQKPGWKIFCIGHATRQLAEKYFGKNLISGSADNAKELAELIIHKANSDEVIFFCGSQRRNELPDLLGENNIRVKEIVVYQTMAAPHKVEKKYDGILFFSPTGVQSFFQENKLDPQTILFAIGNTTADEIKKYLPDNEGSGNKIIVSDRPKKETLLQKAINYFQTHPIHN
jgi:uroporphyrinogen-III synthase